VKYRNVLVAIANAATVPGAWVGVRDVARHAKLTTDEVVSVAGALHDIGAVTARGFGSEYTIRLDAVTIHYPDGTVGVLLHEGHVVQVTDPKLWAASAYEIIHPTGTTNAGSSTP
jgi:hypothetical protein